MLEVTQLHASYGDSAILCGIDIRVKPAQGVALLGRNGAGKTTLLKSLVGGGPRVSGILNFHGKNVASLPSFRRARAGLVLVPEDRRIFAHLSVEENLVMALNSAPGIAAKKIAEIYGFFPELEKLKFRMGDQLSGGQQQILAVARGLMAEPKCMLLDEPTEGVAPLLVKHMAIQINRARKSTQAALLLAEQNLGFSRQCTEFVYVIDVGRIVFKGTWQEFDERPEIADRFLAV
jgi:ABC-type branched-subunit amino acid transport system ATPase component